MPSLALLAIGLILLYVLLRSGKREKYLPPGPPTYPIIGNIPSLPLHIQFTKWAKQYSDVYSVKLGSMTMVILSSVEAVRQIIEKNSALTSDRPPSHFADLVCDVPQPFVVFTRYSDLWRNQRRAMHEMLRAQVCSNYTPIQKAETYQLMMELLNDPEGFASHTRRHMLSTIMSVVYGIRIPRSASKICTEYYEFEERWAELMIPGGQQPVDAFPILKVLPGFLAPWKKKVKWLSKMEKAMFFGFLEKVEERVKRGEGNGCYGEVLLEKGKEWGLDRKTIGYICRTLVEAGSDTTNAALQTFLLFMLAHPHVLKKAQQEVDDLIGPDRVPILEDIEELPYLRAVILETFRFRPIAPIGVPHATSGEVKYKDYLIPEGSTIVVNSWGIFQDEETFPNAQVFDPERFIKDPESAKLVEYLFGAGRRVCPGNIFAKNSLHLIVMTLLWGFNIRTAQDEAGKEIPVDIDAFKQGFVTEPKRFRCDIKPRSAKHVDMLVSEYHASRKDVVHFEEDISSEDRQYINKLA